MPNDDATMAAGSNGTATEQEITRLASQRRQLLERELARWVHFLIEHDNPERIIVFGSLARGCAHEWSDVDLVVVERTDLPFMQRLHDVRQRLEPCVGVDLLVYTPEEFERLCRERPFFQEEMLAKRTVIYERSR